MRRVWRRGRHCGLLEMCGMTISNEESDKLRSNLGSCDIMIIVYLTKYQFLITFPQTNQLCQEITIVT